MSLFGLLTLGLVFIFLAAIVVMGCAVWLTRSPLDADRVGLEFDQAAIEAILEDRCLRDVVSEETLARS